MPIVASFTGGPRAGKKNTLKNFDAAPARIPVEVKETKAVNMQPGRYELFSENEAVGTATYRWVCTKQTESA
jgi:hypothetical protein